MSYAIPNQRLAQQIQFILEVDKLKNVVRRTYVSGAARRENSAEHSWQLALMALTLAEHANEPVDTAQVMKMVIIHDIVEIDAGDTYFFDDAGTADKAEREQKAAERIFGLLPADQAVELHQLWDEFEARETPEARFANAIDRVMPLLLNYETRGKSWRENGISNEQILPRMAHVADGSEAIWQLIQSIVTAATAEGYLSD
ncbi:MAG: HD domain-containing protein [Ardenticatenaceae bacterium]|nr:HD domain-containing protein [Ardenticatenaceae bacterium]MCB9443797.1 HD domain-containing protein [Ardenticatenaceae bacterium]